MRSTYVAQDASVPLVTDRAKPLGWQLDHSPAVPVRDRTKPRDDLRSARGIFVAVIAGSAIWAAIGWGAMTLIGRMIG